MVISIVRPALEMTQESGKVISWLKQEGKILAPGEALLEIETDKAVMQIESPDEGAPLIVSGRKTSAAAPLAAVSAQNINSASRGSRHSDLSESATFRGRAAEFLRDVAEAIGNQ